MRSLAIMGSNNFNLVRLNAGETFSITFSLSEVSKVDHFVAREKEIAEIDKHLSSSGDRQIVILYGLGGMGKTQLAAAYAEKYHNNYSAFLWINSKDKGSIKQSFANIAGRVLREHPSASRLSAVDLKGDLDNVVKGVKQWLSMPKNKGWLIVYDNYDNPKVPDNSDPEAVDIREFLPEAYHGRILITTRSAQVKIGHRIQVQKMSDVEDSLKILSYTSGRGSSVFSGKSTSENDHEVLPNTYASRQIPTQSYLLKSWTDSH